MASRSTCFRALRDEVRFARYVQISFFNLFVPFHLQGLVRELCGYENVSICKGGR